MKSSAEHSKLQDIWDALAHLPTLGDLAEVHRGIEYNISFKEHQSELVSDMPRAGFAPGLVSVTADFEPYVISSFSYLTSDSKRMRRQAYLLPWEKPKVIVNAARISRGAWKMIAAVDTQGIFCTQRFHGLW